MTAMTSTVKQEYSPNTHGKIIKVECVGSTDNTTTVTLADHGITNVQAVHGYVLSSAADGTIIQSNPATAISSGVLTLTFSTANAVIKAAAALTGKRFTAFVYGDTVN